MTADRSARLQRPISQSILATLFVPTNKVFAIGAGPQADDSVAVVDQLIS